MKATFFLMGIILLFPFTVLCSDSFPHQSFVVVQEPLPVFSTSESSYLLALKGSTNQLVDQCGQVRTLEFIALPGAACIVHEVLERDGVTLYRVTTDDYPVTPSKKLFLDARGVKRVDALPPRRKGILPQQAELLQRLESAAGLPYVWGGNVREGVKTEHGRAFQGLDCSGLLYEATGGFTPRNTSELVGFGTPVMVAGLALDAMAAKLKPLDLIVWNGHVIIVLDRQRTIESRLECRKPGHGGVVVRSLLVVLRELFKSRAPVDEWPQDRAMGQRSFVVRRWYKGMDGERK